MSTEQPTLQQFQEMWNAADEYERKEVRKIIRNQASEVKQFDTFMDLLKDGPDAFKYGLLYGLLRKHFEDYYFIAIAVKTNADTSILQKALMNIIASHKDEILNEVDTFDAANYKPYTCDILKLILRFDTKIGLKQMLIDNHIDQFVDTMSQFIYDAIKLLLTTHAKEFPFSIPFIEAAAIIFAEYYECHLIKSNSFNNCIGFLTKLACTLVPNYDKNIIYNIFHAHDSDTSLKEEPGIILIRRLIDIREDNNYYKIISSNNVKQRMEMFDLAHSQAIAAMYVKPTRTHDLNYFESKILKKFKEAYKQPSSKNKNQKGLFIIDDISKACELFEHALE